MFINLRPLTHNKQYRLLFIGQTVSFFGSMMTYVAIPYQVYAITKDSFWVGLVSIVQLIPLVLAGLYGGALADAIDRRRLLLWSEWALFVCAVLLAINSYLASPILIVLIVLTALSSALTGIHRPAMDAIVPQIVEKNELNAVGALGSLRYAIGATAGPALGGILIVKYGAVATYIIDACTFLVSIWAISSMKSVEIPGAKAKADLRSIAEGIKYATSQPIIMGTYLVDIIAMLFAMPIALYPQIVDEFKQLEYIGWLYAAIPLGAGAISLFSRPLDRIDRQGAGVIVSATIWGIFIVAMAFAPSIQWMAVCLFMAGMADSVSGIYRQTIWNEVIPTNIRGRLGSLNMLSYMIGPLIGNARAGTIASYTSTHISILSGGILCVVGCVACIWVFPKFWAYKRKH